MRSCLPYLYFCGLVSILMAAAPVNAGLTAKHAVGEQKILVIMTRFPDVKPSVSPDHMREKYFDRLNRYVRGVSDGSAWVTGKLTDWYTLPQPVGRYKLSPHNLGVAKDRVAALIQQAIDQAGQDEDFSRYDLVFLSLGAGRKNYGMMGLCGYPGMLGWSDQSSFKTSQGQKVPGGVAVFCEEAHLGVVFHDLAHILGGVQGGRRVLPCLYDHDLQGKPGPFRGYAQFYLINVGYFDPMSSHYVNLKENPPGVCAWTKLRLGWLNKSKTVEVRPGETETVLLKPLSDPRNGPAVVNIPIDSQTRYLVENRAPIGVDRVLPGHGVLIYFADDRVAECRRGRSPLKLMNANPTVPELKGAAYTDTGQDQFMDARNKIAVRINAKKGNDYQLTVSHGQ